MIETMLTQKRVDEIREQLDKLRTDVINCVEEIEGDPSSLANELKLNRLHDFLGKVDSIENELEILL